MWHGRRIFLNISPLPVHRTSSVFSIISSVVDLLSAGSFLNFVYINVLLILKETVSALTS